MDVNRIDIKIFLALLLMLFYSQANEAYSQLSGKIECPSAIGDTVDFGICMINDARPKTFIITNTGDKALKIGPSRPSFSIEFAGDPLHLYDHEEFNDNLGAGRELLIQPGQTRNIIVSYSASLDTNTYKYGQKLAKLTIGLYDSEQTQPVDPQDFVDYKAFTLISGKVRTYISGVESVYNFDSVYVNSIAPIEFSWRLSNVSDNNLVLDTQKIEWLTPVIFNDEFQFENIIPLDFPANSGPISTKIYYNPKDIGEDKVRYSLGYSYKDTVGFTRIDLRGFGVEQKLKLMESNASYFNNDTIDIGRVLVGRTKEVFAILANDGNMNFLPESQVINDGFESELESNKFSILQALKNEYYRPTTGDTVKIIFSPDRIGNFYARYRIKSDIDKRNIRGYPPEKLYETIYLKGIGIEPKFWAEYDTVDFGQVISHPDCPSSRTFTLNISNIGNATLTINDYQVQPPFKVEFLNGTFLTLEPNEEKSINIIFSASVLGDYNSILKIITNEKSSEDTNYIYLKASRVNPEAIKLFIPNDIKSKPGHDISIPLIVDKAYISKARTFTSELTYNRTLLRFLSYDKLRTATENTDDNDIVIRELNGGGKLSISISTPAMQTFFLNKDTLIKLNFATYIGDKISTPIAFIEPLFGDGVCDKILLPSDTNGVFSIDSICGLEYKLVPSIGSNFFIAEIFPVPTKDFINIQYQLKAEVPLTIDIINQVGLTVRNVFNGFQKSGFYELSADCSNLSSGIYYLRFSTGIVIISKRIVILR